MSLRPGRGGRRLRVAARLGLALSVALALGGAVGACGSSADSAGVTVGSRASAPSGGTAVPVRDARYQLNQAQFVVPFEGTTFGGLFDVHSGCVVGADYGYSGKGCRLTPDPVTGVASLASQASFPSGQPWTSFSMRFRLVTKPAASDTYMNLMEIGNANPTVPKSQFTVYIDGGSLKMDFNAPEKATLAPLPAVGTWHHLEVRVNYGAEAYVAYVRYDNGAVHTLTSAATKTPTTSKALWIHYPKVPVDYTMDVDGILLSTAKQDPGWLIP